MDEDVHLKLSYLSLQCWLGRKPKDSRPALAIVGGNFGSDSESPIGEKASITH